MFITFVERSEKKASLKQKIMLFCLSNCIFVLVYNNTTDDDDIKTTTIFTTTSFSDIFLNGSTWVEKKYRFLDVPKGIKSEKNKTYTFLIY